jgi:hypothetical protein
VRASATPRGEETWRDAFLSRYRCRACRLQFFGVGRRTYRAGAKVVAAVAIASVALLLFSYLMVPDMKARRSSIDDISSTT